MIFISSVSDTRSDSSPLPEKLTIIFSDPQNETFNKNNIPSDGSIMKLISEMVRMQNKMICWLSPGEGLLVQQFYSTQDGK